MDSEPREILIENLISQLAGLPSIGRKTAQRLAYHLLAQDEASVRELARTLTDAKARIHACAVCGNYTEKEVCRICDNGRRQQNLICVVEKPADILAFERSGSYQGVYHVLGGSISPLDGIGPADLNFAKLWERSAPGQVELILALNTNAEGEATATFIAQKLHGAPVKISRLARGIPVGSELEYVDELTVQRALESRVEVI
ncbi:MAG: replication and repair protein RecR [Fibrobacteres bacterium]|nr:replication and repair protein RecR [Fibrobacterota bacterium]